MHFVARSNASIGPDLVVISFSKAIVGGPVPR